MGKQLATVTRPGPSQPLGLGWDGLLRAAPVSLGTFSDIWPFGKPETALKERKSHPINENLKEDMYAKWQPDAFGWFNHLLWTWVADTWLNEVTAMHRTHQADVFSKHLWALGYEFVHLFIWHLWHVLRCTRHRNRHVSCVLPAWARRPSQAAGSACPWCLRTQRSRRSRELHVEILSSRAKSGISTQGDGAEQREHTKTVTSTVLSTHVLLKRNHSLNLGHVFPDF